MLDSCSKVVFCSIDPEERSALIDLTNESNAVPPSTFTATASDGVMVISRIAGVKEAEVVIDMRSFGPIVGALGSRVALDRNNGRLYTKKCEADFYRCHVVERTFSGEEKIGPVINMAIRDLRVHEGRLYLLYSKPYKNDRSGGLLEIFGHGRYKEDWGVAQIDAAGQVVGDQVLARRRVNASGYFLSK